MASTSDETPDEKHDVKPGEQRALLARLLRQKLSPQKLVASSFAQERMWFLEKWSDGSPAFNMPVAVRLEGDLDAAALARSLAQICRRHDTLRTTFTTDGEGRLWQVVSSEPKLELAHIDCDADSDSDERRAEKARRHIAALATEPFDLEHGPLCRLTLLRHSPRRHDLLVNMHHLVSDLWSLAIFVGELGALYRAEVEGVASALPPLLVQYASFAAWQRECFSESGKASDAELDYWRARLDPNAVLELPTDHARPRTATAEGARRSRYLSAEMVGKLLAFAHDERTTPFVVVLAAFKALLARMTGQTDVVVGTLVAGRTRPELEGLIGLFLNSLALRTSLAGRPTFRDLVRRVHETAIGGFAHQDIPFERLVDALAPARQAGRLPLFQVMFLFQNAPRGDLGAPGLTMSAQPVETATTKHDVTLIAAEESDGRLRLTAEYATALFEAATIERLLGHLENLLAAGCASPERPIDELALLSPTERRALVELGNGRPAVTPTGCVYELIEAQVDRTPDATALLFEGRTLSYRELDRRANQLASWLRELGIGPESRVGICLPRSLELVVALVATLKAGGAYVPLDPAYPEERLATMLEDAAPEVIIVEERLRGRLPVTSATVVTLGAGWEALEGRPETRLSSAAGPGNLAYVIFTSGSTGRPKGAMNEHRAVANRLLWMQEAYRLGAGDVVLQKTPTSFDVSVWELFWPLIAGARLVVARPGGHQDPAYLVDVIAAEGVTTAHFVPSMLRVFLDEPTVGRCASLRRIVCSGEALSVEVAERCLDLLPRAALENLYGPTEAAVDVTHQSCGAGDDRRSIPIGRPIAGAAIRLLDRCLEPVPVGMPGELYIGGVAVGRGYLGRPGLTADRFVPDPFSDVAGARLYRTGDLARWLPDGAIEYLGRTDFQVKIRGVRIELAEIELALEQHPAVVQSAVVVDGEGSENARLCAYVVGRDGAPDTRELAGSLKARLPEHMVPSAFVVLSAMPLTPSGKLDRRALSSSSSSGAGAGAAGGDQPFVAPRDDLERKLAAIWEELLDVHPVGIRQDFFALGGHSLRAARLAVKIERALGKRLPLPLFFERPTVEGLAAAIRDGAAPTSSLVRVKAGASGVAPLFLVHGAGASALVYAGLARHLAPDRPLYVLDAPDDDPVAPMALEAMAAEYLERVRAAWPSGPYLLGGWSFGGVVAFEMARQLAAAGAPAGLLAIIDSRAPLAQPRDLPSDIWLVAGFAAALGMPREAIGFALEGADGLAGRELLAHVLGRAPGAASLDLDETTLRFGRFRRDISAWSRYAAQPYAGSAVFFHAAAHDAWNAGTPADWGPWIRGGLPAREVPGDHFSLLRQPHVRLLAEALTEHLDRLELVHGLHSKHR